MVNVLPHGLGWRREPPDFRDLAFESHEIQGILRISTPYKAVSDAQSVMPASIDLRKWCTRVRDQGAANTSTAFAVTALTEYFERRAFGRHTNYSEQFLYRSTCDLLGYNLDLGADLRTTLHALQTYGMPAEHLYPYDPEHTSAPPPTFCYGFADKFRMIRFFRLDDGRLSGKEVLVNVRKLLASRMPCVFGLSVYTSFPHAGDASDEIPPPEPGEQLIGGQSLLAVGYDDERMIGPNQGALLVRNSWGADWGDKGYGWLPYKWVEHRLAVDFWSYMRPDFVNTDLFN